MSDAKYFAMCMYDAYSMEAGGETYNGKPLPTWDELGENRQSCWIAAANEAIDRRIEQTCLLREENARLRAVIQFILDNQISERRSEHIDCVIIHGEPIRAARAAIREGEEKCR